MLVFARDGGDLDISERSVISPLVTLWKPDGKLIAKRKLEAIFGQANASRHMKKYSASLNIR